jgi:DUF305 family protein family protein
MKLLFVLAIPLLLTVACNDNSASSTDSSTADTMTSAPQNSITPPANQASQMSDGLMGSMTRMMQDMKGMQMTGDPDHDFASMMLKHHNGAIEMSAIEMANGTDSTLKRLAGKITDDSRKDNSEFESFLKEHQATSKSDFGEKAMAMMSKSSTMHTMSGSVDTDYAMMMVQHHKDGIDMANEYLTSGKAAKPMKVAKNMIKMQEKDIKALQSWISENKK